MAKHEVELTDKERALLWAIAAWFQKSPLVTSSLMQKLYFDESHAIAKKYDDKIDDRIIEVGDWLKAKRDELREEK